MKFEDMDRKFLESVHAYPIQRFWFVQKCFKQGYFYILKSKLGCKPYACTNKPAYDEDIIEKVILNNFEDAPIDVFVKMGFKEKNLTIKKYLFLQSYIKGECEDWNDYTPNEELSERIEHNKILELLERIKNKDDKIKKLYEHKAKIEEENRELKRKIRELEKVQSQISELKSSLNKIST